jgi:peptidyl-dipeptidase Dcp
MTPNIFSLRNGLPFLFVFFSLTIAAQKNPLLEKWEGPYNGVPPFDKIQVPHFKPALEASMEEYQKEIEMIANNPEASTFNNTIEALERSGKTYGKVNTVLGIWTGSLSTPEIQAVQKEMAPRLAGFSDKITQNKKLFLRIEQVYNNRHSAKLNAEQQRLAWYYHNNFVRAGAKLDEKAKERLSAINQQLASLYTKFSRCAL